MSRKPTYQELERRLKVLEAEVALCAGIENALEGRVRFDPLLLGTEKHWRDSKIIGRWMGGRALKTLENARYWYDLETI